ncbi:MAG: FAD-dependent oxidoreductase [Actinomycetota bacterium]|nr:FAD-dependent oxidoreductase [Actinomycetota bacterium]
MADDVAIIGAGIVGCSAAWFLAQRGVPVTVIDPAGVGAGASGRNNGLVEHTYDAATTGLFDESVALLSDLLGAAMPSEPVGALLLASGEEEARTLAGHYARFEQLDPVVLDPDATRRAEPLLADGFWGCLLRTGYPISPLEVTQAVAERARAAGARFVLGEPVRLTELRRNHGEVVVAAGAWSGEVLAGLLADGAVAPLWGVIVLVDLPRRPRHAIIEGTVSRGLTAGRIEHVSPFTLLDSPSWLAVGSTLLDGDEPRGEDWAPRLLAGGVRFVPALAHARVHGTLVCARPKSFDNRPLIGLVPGQEHLWIASGHGGRGMSLGLASGRLLADAIVAGSDEPVPQSLRPARLAAR